MRSGSFVLSLSTLVIPTVTPMVTLAQTSPTTPIPGPILGRSLAAPFRRR
jgi:hypothetical protein